MKRSALTVKMRWQYSISLTVAALGVSYYVHVLILSWLHINLPPLITFFPIMMLVNILLGRWNGLFYSVASTILIEALILQPQENSKTVSLADFLTLSLYFAYCLLMIFLVEFSRRHILRVNQLEGMRAQFEISRKFEAALSSMTDAVFIADVQGKVLDCNDAFARMHGFRNKSECPRTKAEFQKLFEIYEPNGELVRPEQWSAPRALAGETASKVERRVRRRDTGEEWIGSFSFAPIRDEVGKISGAVVVVRDVTSEKRTLEELEASNERYRAAFDVSQDGMIVTRIEDGMIHEYNNRITEMLGYRREEIVGKTTIELGVWPDPEERKRVVEKLRDSSPCVDIKMELKSKSGEPIQATVSIKKFRMKGEECLLSDIHDQTKSKRDEEEIKKLGTLAYFDPLTGLVNRRMFIERLEHCIQRNERSGQINGLLYMDLNHFKELNDRYGHVNGDHVLCEYAERLKRAVRKGDTVARIGGDEFVILLENLGATMEQSIEAIEWVEAKISKLIEEPIHLADEDLKCTSSMGVKVFQGGCVSAEQLVSAADLDMYKRKTAERHLVEP